MSLRNGASRLQGAVRSAVPNPPPLAERTVLGTFGVVLTAAVLGLVGGVGGVGLAVAFVVAWLLFRPVYSYVLGHVLALGVSAGALPVVELLFVELGLLAVLLGPLTRPELRTRGTVVRATLGFGFLLFGAVVVSLALFDRLWVGTGLLLLVGVGAAYGLHRYELVVLGLAEADGADADERAGRDEAGESGTGGGTARADADAADGRDGSTATGTERDAGDGGASA